MDYRKIAVRGQTTKIKNITGDNLLDCLLNNRKIKTKKEAERFLNPNEKDFITPYAFLDMEKAKKRIFEAIEKQQKILIWGDFDCDGVTSSAIVYKALTQLKANVITFIPDRLLHGHGLNSKELLQFISKEKVKLVITVDCATSNSSEVNLLKGLKVDTIITDHHDAEQNLAQAYALINPKVQGALSEDLSVEQITSLTYNSGSAVAYKLAMALLENEKDIEDLKDELLITASCGIIADVVPLLKENRAMVKKCLELLNNKKENSSKSIYKLLNQNLGEKEITSLDIAFILAPRINAVGRLANAKLSFDFLTTKEDGSLDVIIKKLNNFNAIRQSKCEQTYIEISNYLKTNKEELNNPAIILMNENWHIGIIGIVASKVVEEFKKPCFLLTKDENNKARCSIRSNDTINVYQVLKENSQLFEGFGGHKLAGGCSFDLDTITFDEVKKNLLKTISELKEDSDESDILYADLELQANDIELNTIEKIAKLEPYGQNNEQPLFCMYNVKIEEVKLIGKEKNHLSIIISKDDKTIKCVRWCEDEFKIPKGDFCDIAFYLQTNTFNDETSLQLELIGAYSEKYCNSKTDTDFKIFDHRKKTGILDQIASYLSKDGLDIGVWAKNPSTKEVLSKYEKIKNNFMQDIEQHRGLMFFDYPSSYEEFLEILSTIKPKRVHLMNNQIDENLENYIKQLNGMIKYCANKLDGLIDITKIALTLCLSETFVQIALEIFETLGSIEILDIDKIKYIKPFNYEEFKNNSLFELLKSEFDKNIEFKKSIMDCSIEELKAKIK